MSHWCPVTVRNALSARSEAFRAVWVNSKHSLETMRASACMGGGSVPAPTAFFLSSSPASFPSPSSSLFPSLASSLDVGTGARVDASASSANPAPVVINLYRAKDTKSPMNEFCVNGCFPSVVQSLMLNPAAALPGGFISRSSGGSPRAEDHEAPP
eukprot:CAMPEP_0198707324 /NCGR_PEP_ID=MMETSP1468-20131203/391421_1 /TAXON_ID=1461545 /ORGANISM="Mantoniella sp, Strain CCMP1436" /LENGTH=155 /DNA_ID=CAMNT_0044466291 /DNA_START=270 /DNA_END=737 /DNA_ORIENTATION=-